MNRNKKILKTVSEELQLEARLEKENKELLKKERLDSWKEKALSEKFLMETEGLKEKRRWQWLKVGE